MNNLLITFTVIIIIIALACVGISIYGLVIAFTSHILTGVIALVIEPLPLIIGGAKLFFHINIADMITHLIGLK